MRVFQADEAKRVLRYACVYIDIDNHVQLLHYILLVLPDYEVFDLMWQELRVFNLDLIGIAEANNFPMMRELRIALSIEERVCTSQVNIMDVISEVIFTDIEETSVPESRQDKRTLDIERTLDFSIKIMFVILFS
jgi:hypothetical protein